jgi:hypothetical protein
MTSHVKGKTFWIAYAARRRLGEEKPFMWYRERVCYIFVKDGVFTLPVNGILGSQFKPFLWTFIEADEHSTGVPDGFISNYTNLYMIFPTFPEELRWKPLTKCTSVARIIMNPWSLEEMHQA